MAALQPSPTSAAVIPGRAEEVSMLDIAITGTGIVSGLGCGSRKYHDAMMAGEIAIREAPWYRGQHNQPNWWAIVRDFNPRDWLDEKIESGTDMFSQFALAAARQAIDEAKLGGFDPERSGVVHGTSMGGTRALMKAQFLLDTGGPQQIPRKTEIQIYPNMAASQIAMEYDLHGPSLTVTTACASSLDAIGTASHMVDRHDVELWQMDRPVVRFDAASKQMFKKRQRHRAQQHGEASGCRGGKSSGPTTGEVG
jgi:3-oxoacyl-(acyl-carrier-protein) synthase